MIDICRTVAPDCRIMLGVSPVVFDMSDAEGIQKERVFPKILNVESDHRVFYEGTRVGLPSWLPVLLTEYENAYTAGHGIPHVDHRLLDYAAQELSIVQSCAIARSHTFIPPFHKWNKDTEAICNERGIELVKLDTTKMRHVLYHNYDPDFDVDYYFHTHDFETEDFADRMGVEYSPPHTVEGDR